MCQLRKWHRRAAARHYSHYNRKVNKEDTMQVFDSVDLLCDVYGKYIAEQGLPPVSSDEQDRSELTQEQLRWIEAFEELWDLAT
tara:strand:- start:376 stop:627 length:252 start_codon:yes stop_codon:yes gene_type:complete